MTASNRPPSSRRFHSVWGRCAPAVALRAFKTWVTVGAVLASVAPSTWAQAASPVAGSSMPASRLAAQWEGPALEGTMRLRLIVLDAERGVVAAALTLGSMQCSGGLDSLGQWQQGTLVLQPYRPEPDAAACEVRVRVDASGRRATVSETGCAAYRGAACVFEGQLQAR